MDNQSALFKTLIQVSIFALLIAFISQNSKGAGPVPKCESICEELSAEVNSNEKLKAQLLEVKSSHLAFLSSINPAASTQVSGVKANLALAEQRINALNQKKKEIERKRKLHHCAQCYLSG